MLIAMPRTIVSPPSVSDDALLAQLDRATEISLRRNPERQPWSHVGDSGGLGRSARDAVARQDPYTYEYDRARHQAEPKGKSKPEPDAKAVYTYLATHGCRTRQQLAEHFRASFLLLDRALTQLRDAGIVTTHYGPAGGVCAAGYRGSRIR
jgi:hypothetical protein